MTIDITSHHHSEHLTHPKYRADIDGLRAIAVLSVVGFHAFPNAVKGGFIGVDIFFVISGFLISTIIFENLERDSFSFVEFYSRRIKRIFPALLLVLIVSYAFGWFVLLADEYKQLGKHIAGGAGFISNFMFWKESGYFDNAADTKPLLHLWSLGIEEQFYIVWPLLLWFAWRQRLNLLTITITVFIISFALNINKVQSDTVAAFYSPQTRFWELLSGSVLAYFTLYKQNIFSKFKQKLDVCLSAQAIEINGNTLRSVQSLLGAALIAIGIIVITKDKHFPGWWAVLPTIGAVLIISAGLGAWLNRAILSNRVLVWFGLISFPLYLWHWPLLSFARIIESEKPSQGIRITAVFISMVLAWLTYRLIEKPIRFGTHSKTKTITLLVLMIAVGYAGYNCYKLDGLVFRKIAKKSVDFTYKIENLGYLKCQNEPLLSDLGFCFISPNGKSNAALIGDSHAADKFYGIAHADKDRHWMLIGNHSCPPVYGINVESMVKDCQPKFENIIGWLSTSSDIKIVGLSFFGNIFLTTSYAADHIQGKRGPQITKISSKNSSGTSRTDIFFNGLNNTVDILEKSGKQVILMIDVPELPFFPRDCYRNPYKKCQLTKSEAELRQREQRALIAKLKQHHPLLMIFDPINLICPKDFCLFQNEDLIIYRDSHHLTLRGSDLYAQYFLDWLNHQPTLQHQ
ncbi:MAG: acyltransferase [Methylococcaceae bacterium]|nr:acyltransferase [Methylococcaceae bacterium]